MITTYNRGNVTLTADQPAGSDRVELTLTRNAPLTDADVQRLNRELADYGAELAPAPTSAGWVLRTAEKVLDTEPGTGNVGVLTGSVPA